MHRAGVLFSDSSDKAARFIWICNAFNIPLLFLTDISGYMIGAAVEREGIIRHGAKMLYAVCESTVPRIDVLVRKAYGGGYLAMSGSPTHPDAVLALPTAKPALMGPAAAVNAIHFNRVLAIEDPDERARFVEEERAKVEAEIDVFELANENAFEAVVPGDELRDELIRRFRTYRRGHGRQRARPAQRGGADERAMSGNAVLACNSSSGASDMFQILDAEGNEVGPVPKALGDDDLVAMLRLCIFGRDFDKKAISLQRRGQARHVRTDVGTGGGGRRQRVRPRPRAGLGRAAVPRTAGDAALGPRAVDVLPAAPGPPARLDAARARPAVPAAGRPRRPPAPRRRRGVGDQAQGQSRRSPPATSATGPRPRATSTRRATWPACSRRR